MKKFLFSILAVSLLLGYSETVFAKPNKNSAESDKQAKHAEKEALRSKELEGKEWAVTLYKSDAKGIVSDSQTGTLTFMGEKLTFNGFKIFSLGPIGYTLTAYDDNERGTWETYRAGETSVSVRGDWEGTIMNGVISEQSEGGKKVVNSRFSSVNQVKDLPQDTAVSEASAGSDSSILTSTSPEAALVSKETPKVSAKK